MHALNTTGGMRDSQFLSWILRNAFNVVSRQAFLSECSLHFPELYPWALWGYSQHPTLWHPMGT